MTGELNSPMGSGLSSRNNLTVPLGSIGIMLKDGAFDVIGAPLPRAHETLHGPSECEEDNDESGCHDDVVEVTLRPGAVGESPEKGGLLGRAELACRREGWQRRDGERDQDREAFHGAIPARIFVTSSRGTSRAWLPQLFRS